VVSDSGPLIWLAKAGRIRLLHELFEEVLVPFEVYNEVVSEGLKAGFSDAIAVEEAVKEGWMKVVSPAADDEEVSSRISAGAKEIHLGEAQAIAFARSVGETLLMDESSGRALAEALGVKVRGTLYVVLRSLRRGSLSKREAKDVISGIVAKGFRLEPRLLARVLEEIDRFRG
jgi:predicted nucleic acid-binding protein